MVVIRLSRTGAKNKPKYRFTVSDSRKPLQGRFIEVIGYYDPLAKDKKAKYESWIHKGAKPSKTVKNLFAKSV